MLRPMFALRLEASTLSRLQEQMTEDERWEFHARYGERLSAILADNQAKLSAKQEEWRFKDEELAKKQQEQQRQWDEEYKKSCEESKARQQLWKDRMASLNNSMRDFEALAKEGEKRMDEAKIAVTRECATLERFYRFLGVWLNSDSWEAAADRLDGMIVSKDLELGPYLTHLTNTFFALLSREFKDAPLGKAASILLAMSIGSKTGIPQLHAAYDELERSEALERQATAVHQTLCQAIGIEPSV